MSVEAPHKHPANSPADRILLGFKSFVSGEPLVAGIVAGILFGGLANSGILFFSALLVTCLVGAHLKAGEDD